MALETGTVVNDLTTTNPTSSDPKSQGDDHLRLLKTVLKNSFAGFTGTILLLGTEAQGATVNDFVATISPAPAAYTAGMTVFVTVTHTNTGAATLKVNSLTAKTLYGIDNAALAAGDLVSGQTLVACYDGTNFVVISGNDKASKSGDTYTGTHAFGGAIITVATQAAGNNSTKAASTAYVDTAAFNTALPAQGSAVAGSVLVTDTVNASWDKDDITLITPFSVAGTAASAGELRLYEDTDNGTNYLSIKAPTLIASNKTLTFPDSVGTSGDTLKTDGTGILSWGSGSALVLLSTASASTSATIDLETTIDSTYDKYLILITALVPENNAVSLRVRLKIGGSYLTTSTYSYFNEQMRSNAATFSGDQLEAIDYMKIANDMSNGAAASCNAEIWIHNPASTTKRKHMYGRFLADAASSGNLIFGNFYGVNSGTAALTGVRIYTSTGNIISGNFALYGVKKTV
jgi:hypothetical protein